jgi:hypothetical protein
LIKRKIKNRYRNSNRFLKKNKEALIKKNYKIRMSSRKIILIKMMILKKIRKKTKNMKKERKRNMMKKRYKQKNYLIRERN